ncbi:MAG: hypothetical protein GX339_10710 [Tissierellia bacterium]|nr:hypothetical protein [Tissierellia bacterium]
MTLKVSGYVDGEPVYFEEPEPTKFEAEAEVEEKPSYEVEISAEDEHGNVGMVHSRYYMSGSWIEPVWQRTQADVDYALRLNNKIAKNGWSSLTPQEQSDWAAGLIGCLNYWDLNRIEMDSEFLSNLLHQYGYGFGGLPVKTDWDMTDFPHSAEMERIRTNVQTLIDVYHEQDIPLPENLQNLDWRKLNDLENVLKLMKEMIHRMEQSFRYSGAFYCGQEVAL